MHILCPWAAMLCAGSNLPSNFAQQLQVRTEFPLVASSVFDSPVSSYSSASVCWSPATATDLFPHLAFPSLASSAEGCLSGSLEDLAMDDLFGSPKSSPQEKPSEC